MQLAYVFFVIDRPVVETLLSIPVVYILASSSFLFRGENCSCTTLLGRLGVIGRFFDVLLVAVLFRCVFETGLT